MSSIKLREINYGKYGKCAEVTNGKIELIITLDMGPRIIKYSLLGRENVFCNNTEETYEKTGWKILGGHRLWISPEHDILTYEPDNAPIQYREIPEGVHIIGNVEEGTGLRKEMFIAIEEEGTNIAIKHCITNNNHWPVEISAWALSVMKEGGKEVIPINKEDTGLLSNCDIALWPYTKMSDKRVWWGDRYITLKQDRKAENPFKIGITNTLGWAAYFVDNMAFIKKFQHMDYEDIEYPDNGMNYETYTNNFMLEMESLSPLAVLQKDESIVHLELWSLIDDVKCPKDNDDEIDALLAEIMPDCVNDSAESCECDDHECGCGDECHCHDEEHHHH